MNSNASEIVRNALRLLEEQEQEREAKLKALRQAAKQGYDEIDQGKGIVLKGKKAIARFMTEIDGKPVAGSPARNTEPGGGLSFAKWNSEAYGR